MTEKIYQKRSEIMKTNYSEKVTYYKNSDIVETGTISAAGKITLTENDEYTCISGYKTVVLDSDACVETICAGNYENPITMQEFTMTGSKDMVPIYGKINANGSVTLKEGAYAGDIRGYKSVTVNGGSVNTLAGMTGVFSANNNEGCWMVDASGDYSFTEVKVTDKVDWNKVNGKLTVVENAKFAGTAKLSGMAYAEYIVNFATVTVTDAYAGNVSLADQIAKSHTFTYKNEFNKKGTGYVVYDYKKTQTAAGSLTVKGTSEVLSTGSIDGYKTVKLTHTFVNGDIKGALNKSETRTVESARYETTEEMVEFANMVSREESNFFPEGDGRLLAYTSKSSANGSLTVNVNKKDDNSIEIAGCISDFSNVTLNGFSSGEYDSRIAVYGSIAGKQTVDVKYKDGFVYDNVKKTAKGTGTFTIKVSAAGALKLTAADVIDGDVSAFKDVTTQGGAFYGSVYAYNQEDFYAIGEKYSNFWNLESLDVYSSEDCYANYSYELKSVGNIKANGGTRTNTYTEKASAAGTFSATDAYFENDASIDGFTNVKFTNVKTFGTVDVAGSNTISSVSVQKHTYSSYYAEEAETVVVEENFTSKAAGKMTFKVDKKAGFDEYEIGSISSFLNVDVIGFDGKIDGVEVEIPVTVNGSITGGYNTQTKKKFTIEEGLFTPETDNSKWNYTQVTAVGTAKLSNVVVNEDVTGFATVNLTDAVVEGSVTTGSTMEKFDLADSATANTITKYKSVVGALNLSDAQVEGSISGFKAVDVKADINYIGSYIGTAVAVEEEDKVSGDYAENAKSAKETLTIAKNAVLTVGEEGIELQAEDKLVVNGELVFWGDAVGNGPVVWSAVRDEYISPLRGGIAEVSGKGKIYANESAAGVIGELKGANVVNLGETSRFFQGSKAESDQSAIIWNGEETVDGWIGMGGELGFTDASDEIKFFCEGIKGEEKELLLDFWGEYESFEVTVNGTVWEFGDACMVNAGEENIIKITRTGEGSTSYSISVAPETESVWA